MALVSGFSEETVQAELDRIRTEHVEQGQFALAAAACERLAAAHAESKWLGNILLVAASCYRELGMTAEEIAALDTFLSACPQHVQAPMARHTLESLKVTDSLKESAHQAVKVVEDALAQLRADHEQLAATVQALAERVDDLTCSMGDPAAPTAAELAHALAQDMNQEVAAQRERLEQGLAQLDRSPGRLSRLTLGAAAAALVCSLLALGLPLARPPAPAPAAVPVHRQAAVKPSMRITRTYPAPVTHAVVPATKPQPPAPAKPEPRPETKASASSAVPSAPAADSYVVQPGDTLWSIGARTLGNGKTAQRIATANGLAAPYRLQPGQTLRIPR